MLHSTAHGCVGIKLIVYCIPILFIIFVVNCKQRNKETHFRYSQREKEPSTHKYCLNLGNSIKARHRSCFLRPDTGPCRADIVQWYFDVRRDRCFRFFWGGCQGNGNRFETRQDCLNSCYFNNTMKKTRQVPFYCSISFEFGTCYGHYTRWAWDKFSKTCLAHTYSGCGGNQNNFQTREMCMKTCLHPRNASDEYNRKTQTTCITFHMDDLRD